MFKVNSDPSKNRLYITLEELDETVIKPILKDLSENVGTLTPGFTCLVDIQKMSYEEHSKGADYVEIIQGALTDAGMKKVVRIVDKNNLGPQDLMNENSALSGYYGDPAYSTEEAEKILDQST